MRLLRADFGDPQLRDLLRAHLDDMHTNSPPGTMYALDLSGLQHPAVELWTVWDGSLLAGCGAIKALDDAGGELKSMRTHPAQRRPGVGALVLAHLLGIARARGYRRVSLETGTGPAFEPALALYRKAGFVPGPVFGEYTASEFNQFLHLELA